MLNNTYCHHLKLYFEFLNQKEIDFKDITIDNLSLFVNWLQNPYESLKVVPVEPVEVARKPKTVNIIVNTVLNFYDYLLRHEEYRNNISERLNNFVRKPGGNYKGFLYGIADEKKKILSNILKLKVPEKKPKILSKQEIETLVKACSNYRDKFLLVLLFESGLRIGEALSLWVEDINVTEMVIDLKDRGESKNRAEVKTVNSPRKIDISQNLADMYMEYLVEFHTAEVSTNHVFVKLSGDNKGNPMNYVDVNNLFRRLKKKAGIQASPHMFRHSSLTFLRKAGWEPEHLRVRAGHKNIYTTLNTYIHPSQEEISEEFKKVNSSLDLDQIVKGGDNSGAHSVNQDR